jgi:cleavage stimulation factor subunit 3
MSSFVLNFAFAETLELKGKFEDVHEVFRKFLEVLRLDLEDVEARVSSANSSLVSMSSQDAAAINGNASTMSNGGIANATANTTIPDGSSSFALDERPSKPRELAERRTEYGLVWIMYMRFSRRAEGLKAWRGVFKEARKDRWTPWEVYEAAGMHVTTPPNGCIHKHCHHSANGVSLYQGRRNRQPHL